jgi:hypothetical protein
MGFEMVDTNQGDSQGERQTTAEGLTDMKGTR